MATRRNPFPLLSAYNRRCYRLTDRRPMKRMVKTFMYKHPRRESGLAIKMAMLAPVVLLLMVAVVPLHVGSRASVAAIGPLAVSGTVYSATGTPVVGANVVVTIWNGGTLRATQLTTSISSPAGFYEVTFSNSEWDTGNTIQVAAEFNSATGLNSTVADEIGNPFPTIDVHLGTVVPELAGPVTTVLTVSAIGIMVMLLARRRGPSPL